jgi:succinate dehydrogenase / fumarate reductase, membrane anchor subunit
MTARTAPPVGARSMKVNVPSNYANIAWKWMRYSGILLIPLVWIHVGLQDVIVGVHKIDLSYVAQRWMMMGWKLYDIALLAFAFAHGINGFRQVLLEAVHSDRGRQVVSWVLLIGWFVISAIGATAIIMGARVGPQ